MSFMRYIQRKDNQTGQLETVDEVEIKNTTDRKELQRLVGEYRLADKSAEYYTSSRACKAWREK